MSTSRRTIGRAVNAQQRGQANRDDLHHERHPQLAAHPAGALGCARAQRRAGVAGEAADSDRARWVDSSMLL